jgi:hypothetical protein
LQQDKEDALHSRKSELAYEASSPAAGRLVIKTPTLYGGELSETVHKDTRLVRLGYMERQIERFKEMLERPDVAIATARKIRSEMEALQNTVNFVRQQLLNDPDVPRSDLLPEDPEIEPSKTKKRPKPIPRGRFDLEPIYPARDESVQKLDGHVSEAILRGYHQYHRVYAEGNAIPGTPDSSVQYYS